MTYDPDVEVKKMRKLMLYGAKDFRQDWELAQALAVLMAMGPNERHLRPLLDGCMNRVLAYLGNHPDARPF